MASQLKESVAKRVYENQLAITLHTGAYRERVLEVSHWVTSDIDGLHDSDMRERQGCGIKHKGPTAGTAASLELQGELAGLLDNFAATLESIRCESSSQQLDPMSEQPIDQDLEDFPEAAVEYELHVTQEPVLHVVFRRLITQPCAMRIVQTVSPDSLPVMLQICPELPSIVGALIDDVAAAVKKAHGDSSRVYARFSGLEVLDATRQAFAV